MAPGRRFGIAGGCSVAFHAVVLVAIGLLFGRTPIRPPVLIPIELTMAEAAADGLLLGAGGQPDAPKRTSESAAAKREPAKEQPSSSGGRAKSAPAAPKLLTAKSGTEPAGPEGVGADAAGPGGEEEKPAGPTRGPGIVGGPEPVYPKDALDQGLEGRVSLSVLVSADGSASSVAVAKSSGHELLDRAAVRAVKSGWTFRSALENGEPVEGKCAVTFVFSSAKVQKE